MKFAVSKEIITPNSTMKLACSGVFDADFTSVHDDIYVRCLVISNEGKHAVLMSMDLLFHDHALNDAIAEYANSKYGIPKSSLVLGYTHSHTSPATRGYNLNHHDEHYEELLIERAKSCLDRAMCSFFDGTLEYGVFNADFNISRRGEVNGKHDRMFPDFNYPHDRELWVMCIRDKAGSIRSITTTYGCHPVFYPTTEDISGEFPARLCQLLDAEFYGCTSLFFQSAGADVRPRPTVHMENFKANNGSSPWHYDLTFSDVDFFAKSIFASVCDFAKNGDMKKTELEIDSDAFKIQLPIDGRPLEYFEKCKNELINTPDTPNRCHAIHIADGGYSSLADSLALECSLIKLSDKLYIATVGGEPCYGVKVAATSPLTDKDVCFIGYTDSCAYIVDDRILSEGGYEPSCHLEYCLKGPFKSGLNERYTRAFKESFNRINSK